MEVDIVDKSSLITDLKNEIDDLKVKEGPLSVVSMEKVQAKLNKIETENHQKDCRISQLEADL